MSPSPLQMYLSLRTGKVWEQRMSEDSFVSRCLSMPLAVTDVLVTRWIVDNDELGADITIIFLTLCSAIFHTLPALSNGETFRSK